VVGADVPITDYVAGNDSGGGSLSYSGLLSVGDIQDVAAGTKTIDDLDPGNRAVIAWQAYDSYAAADLVNYSPVSSLTPQGTGSYIEDDNVGDCWVAFDDWHYIGDKSDDSFVDEIFNDADGDGEEDDMVYSIVAIGAPGSDGSLVPATGGNVDGSMVSLADGDMVIFMASRFASTNWGDPNNPQAYLLEPDTYTTSLYIELIHE